ncbi:MAG TPA: hypothetical protein VMU16_06045 [Candidatus Binataceae bacterium]|nr:hypothetical protein [Candidatus Binataceae bacterium]
MNAATRKLATIAILGVAVSSPAIAASSTTPTSAATALPTACTIGGDWASPPAAYVPVPSSAASNGEAVVTVTLTANPKLKKDSVVLLSVDAHGKPLGTLGTMQEKELGAGWEDYNKFTGKFDISELPAGHVLLAIRAAFDDKPACRQSDSLFLGDFPWLSASQISSAVRTQQEIAQFFKFARAKIGDANGQTAAAVFARKQPGVADAVALSDGISTLIKYASGIQGLVSPNQLQLGDVSEHEDVRSWISVNGSIEVLGSDGQPTIRSRSEENAQRITVGMVRSSMAFSEGDAEMSIQDDGEKLYRARVSEEGRDQARTDLIEYLLTQPVVAGVEVSSYGRWTAALFKSGRHGDLQTGKPAAWHLLPLTPGRCAARNGLVVSEPGCIDGTNIGGVLGMACSCVCCVGEKVIDCERNKVEISDACDAGTELHIHLKAMGPETPISIIRVFLDGPDFWGGFDSFPIESHDETLRIPKALIRSHDGVGDLNAISARIRSYTVDYKNAPLSGCNFDLWTQKKEIPIKKCAP